jgi:predicted ATP-dependent endonuclease of OLD family
MKNDFLWNSEEFFKESWGNMNYLIGPNGTGKSIFLEQLLQQLRENYSIRYINSEKLAGLEKSEDIGSISSSSIKDGVRYSGDYRNSYKSLGERGYPIDLLIELKENPETLIKVQTILNQYFGRRIELDIGGGFLNLKINSNYDYRKSESQGLKSLILVLTAIYEKDKGILIIDEPELHFHPQLQQFIIEIIREHGINKNKKKIVIATHSPYVVDIRNIDDLKNCIFFRPNHKPIFIGDSLNGVEETKIKSLIPSINSSNKQFFFANYPIFVEGFSDRNIYSLILEKSDLPIGAHGSSLIDIGGRNKFDVYFNICKVLEINSSFILDLDAIFDKQILDLLTEYKKLQKTKEYLSNITINEKIEKLHDELNKLPILTNLNNVSNSSVLYEFNKKYNNELKNGNNKRHYILIKAVVSLYEDLISHYRQQVEKIKDVKNLIEDIIKDFSFLNVFLLPKGELENYYITTNNSGNQVNKLEHFIKEMNYLEDLNKEQVLSKYEPLIVFFKKILNIRDPDFIKTINFYLTDWIHLIQKAYQENPLINEQELRKYLPTYPYDALWDIESFINDIPNQNFCCKIKLKLVLKGKILEFDNNVIPAKFMISN